MAENTINYTMSLHDHFSGVMEHAEKSAEKMEKRLEKINEFGKEFFASLGVGLAAFKIAEEVKEGVEEYRKLKVIQGEINQLWKNANNFSERNVKLLKEQREELEEMYGIGEDVTGLIQKSIVNMFPMSGINKIKELTELAENYQIATGKDSSGLLKGLLTGKLSKVLGEEGKEISKQIKKMEAAGVSREKILDKEVEALTKHYKQVAEESFKADPFHELDKQKKIFADHIRDLSGTIAEHFLPGAIRIIDGLNDFVKNHFEAITKSLIGISTALKDIALLLGSQKVLGALKGFAATAGGVNGTAAVNGLGKGLNAGFGIKIASDIVSSLVGGEQGNDISTVGNYTAIGAFIGNLVPGIGTAVGAATGAIVGIVTSDWQRIQEIWAKESENWLSKVEETFKSLGDKIGEMLYGKIPDAVKEGQEMHDVYGKNPLFKNLSRNKYSPSAEDYGGYIRELANAKKGKQGYEFNQNILSTNEFLKDYKELTDKQSEKFSTDFTAKFGANIIPDKSKLGEWEEKEAKILKLQLKASAATKKNDDKWNIPSKGDLLNVKGPKNINIYVTINGGMGNFKIENTSTGNTFLEPSNKKLIKDEVTELLTEALGDAQNQAESRTK